MCARTQESKECYDENGDLKEYDGDSDLLQQERVMLISKFHDSKKKKVRVHIVSESVKLMHSCLRQYLWCCRTDE